MTDIDTRPSVVNIDHYAGDTLTIHIKVSDTIVNNRTWTGQVRDSRESRKKRADFTVSYSKGEATAVLSHADCKELARHGKFVGVWDIQLAGSQGANVTTLVTGALRIHPDVTRVTP